MDGDLKDKFITGTISIKLDYVKGEAGKMEGILANLSSDVK